MKKKWVKLERSTREQAQTPSDLFQRQRINIRPIWREESGWTWERFTLELKWHLKAAEWRPWTTLRPPGCKKCCFGTDRYIYPDQRCGYMYRLAHQSLHSSFKALWWTADQSRVCSLSAGIDSSSPSVWWERAGVCGRGRPLLSVTAT